MNAERLRSPFESTRARVLAVALLSGAIAQLILSASAADAPPGGAAGGVKLELGEPVERALGRGETHVFVVDVPNERVVSGVVEQRGIDVVVRVLDPTGAVVATIDSPNGPQGPEPWTAGKRNKAAGAWRIEVSPFAPDSGSGRYEASITEVITAYELAERRAKRAYESPRMRRLWSEVQSEGAGAIDRFSKEMNGRAPMVEPVEGDSKGDVLLTFAWRGQPEDGYLAVVGPSIAAASESPMRRFEGTDLFFLTARVPKDSRFTYGFRQGTPLTGLSFDRARELRPAMEPDRWSARQFFGGSFLELPDAPAQPFAERADGVRQGRIEETSIPSKILGEDRKVGVYLPPGFDPAAGPYPYVIVFDGEVSGLPGTTLLPVPTILDNLIAKGKVPPTLAVLVDTHGKRERDLAMSAPFAEFLAKELAPWAQREYRAAEDPARATLAGVSLGGLAAAYGAFHHPEVFGNALSQSGSFWFTPGARQVAATHHLEPGALIREIRDAPKKPLKIWMEVGIFEGMGDGLVGGGMIVQNRHLRDVLLSKGYDVSYREFSGGHDYACWRGSLADGLIALVGAPPRP
jgi:enterochelin esterase family protein